MKAVFLSILTLVSLQSFSQESAINRIDEVQIYSHFSPKLQLGYSIHILSDSILKSNNDRLSEVLNKYTSVYIKEQGSGMTASISLRGSSASHTAVYWNGIPVNSSLNGQTDFNTVFSSLYNKISIRKGGGSVLLGSGAIGGAINLENDLIFNNKTTASIYGSVGSYKSYSSALNISHSTDKVAVQVGFNGFLSTNNYPYYDSQISNKNAEIKNYALQVNTGYKLNDKQLLYIKALYNNSDRNTPGTLYSSSLANLVYETRNLLVGWKQTKKLYRSELKMAYLKEDYNYIFSKNKPEYFSDNGIKKWITNYDFNYYFNTKLLWQAGVNYELLVGKGTDIDVSKQHKTAFFTALHHELTKKFSYNLNVRKDWSSVYKIPIVFSIASKQAWSEQHTTKFNFSTNYRIPTFNDLYWKPGGNSELIPEKNWSVEIAYEWKIPKTLNVRGKSNNRLGVNVYKSHSTNLIQWKPVTGTLWQPFNIQNVTTLGYEVELEKHFVIKKHAFSLHSQYSYTLSKDLETQKQLIYSPKHIGKILLNYVYKKWYFDFNEQYVGAVYTTTSNTASLKAYWLSNIRVKRGFFNQKFELGMDINNIFNRNYQIVSARPMPNRNFNLNFKYKF